MARAKQTKAKPKPKPKPKAAKQAPEPSLGLAVVEIDPTSFPDDLRAHALELVPIVRELRELAAKRPKQIKVGPPTTRDRVEALAKHYSASLLPEYTALMMLADGLDVEDSFRLYSIDTLTSPRLTKRSEKLRGGYSDCLPIGLFSLSGGWLYVMAKWGEPYCEKVMGMKIQRASIKPVLEEMVKAARKLR
jgi:hypothetical protein